MDIGLAYRDIGDVSIAGLSRLCQHLTAADWLANPHRQRHYPDHQQTESIIGRLPIHGGDGPWLSELMPLMASALRQAQAVSPGYERLSGCVLVKLPPSGVVLQHRDLSPYFAKTRRFHVPILTNAQVTFTIGRERLNMQAGRLYEINNLMPHGVFNGGDTDRIHLIFDMETTHVAADH